MMMLSNVDTDCVYHYNDEDDDGTNGHQCCTSYDDDSYRVDPCNHSLVVGVVSSLHPPVHPSLLLTTDSTTSKLTRQHQCFIRRSPSLLFLVSAILLISTSFKGCSATSSFTNITSSPEMTLEQQQQQQQQRLLSRKVKAIDASKVVYCRVTVVATMYTDLDGTNKDDRMTTSCIPIDPKTGYESDTMYPIKEQMVPMLMERYRKNLVEANLHLMITNATIGHSKLVVHSSSKYEVMHADNKKDHDGVHRRILRAQRQQKKDRELRREQQLQTLFQQNQQVEGEHEINLAPNRKLLGTALDWKSVMTVAIVRVSTRDSTPTATAATLRQTFFNPNVPNFVNQYAACSRGQLQFVPTPRLDSTASGVMDVYVDAPVSNYGNNAYALLVDEAQAIVKRTLGLEDVTDLADRILFCLPEGTGSWAASAGLKHFRVNLNDKWCTSLSGTMHELGHTLGLLHAHSDEKEYEDNTSYMGSGSPDHVAPLKCFNAYELYKFGWYNDRAKYVGPESARLIHLAAFVDYAHMEMNQAALINVANTYYLLYNRNKSYNVDNPENQNRVTVTEPLPDGFSSAADGFPDGTDTLKDGLIPRTGQQFKVQNFQNSGRTLIIEACLATSNPSSDGSGTIIDSVYVSVGLDVSVCYLTTTSAPTPYPTNQPVTPAPIAYPTYQPVTPAPISYPTFQPITRAPISYPTFQPITLAPVPIPFPTQRPVRRTKRPIPTRKPVLSPVRVTDEPFNIDNEKATLETTSYPPTTREDVVAGLLNDIRNNQNQKDENTASFFADYLFNQTTVPSDIVSFVETDELSDVDTTDERAKEEEEEEEKEKKDDGKNNGNKAETSNNNRKDDNDTTTTTTTTFVPPQPPKKYSNSNSMSKLVTLLQKRMRGNT